MDCIFWDEHTGKCLNGKNLNYGEECDNLESFPCFSPQNIISLDPCFWSDGKNVCTKRDSGMFQRLCTGSGCWFYKPPEEIHSDQTAKADAGKLELTLVPRQIIREIAKVRMYGKQKYKDPDIWKDISPERLRNAAYRHFLSYLDDPHGVDEESGISHLSHLATNIAFLIELENNHED